MDESQLFAASSDIPLQSVSWPEFERAGLRVRVRRDDLIHRLVSGNKFYKLFFNIQQARSQGFGLIQSFGGAWSNHLHALAALGAEQGMSTLAVVRGERSPTLSATLLDAEAWGMKLDFVSRAEYRDKAALMPQLKRDYGHFYSVPEGGANLLGAKGCEVWGRAISRQDKAFDILVLPAATGGTLAGLAAGVDDGKQVTGVVVLKGEGQLESEVDEFTRALGNGRQNWTLQCDYHCGGYAKNPDYLRRFAADFEACNKFSIEPVYGAKMWWAMSEMAKSGAWTRGTDIIAVHTGGLQGRRGFGRDC